MLSAEGRDPRVMHPSPGNSGVRDKRPQLRPVRSRLGQEHDSRRLEPGVELV